MKNLNGYINVNNLEDLIGNVIKSVLLNETNTSILFRTNNESFCYSTDRGWIEDIANVSSILDKEIIKVVVQPRPEEKTLENIDVICFELISPEGTCVIEFRSIDGGFLKSNSLWNKSHFIFSLSSEDRLSKLRNNHAR